MALGEVRFLSIAPAFRTHSLTRLIAVGASTVKSLAEEGANILIVFTSASSEQLSKDILASLPPGRHDLVQADMSTLEAPKTIIDAATRLWGGRM